MQDVIASYDLGYIVFYDAASGRYASATLADNGTLQMRPPPPENASTGWDTIVPIGQSCLLFYNRFGDVALAEYWYDDVVHELRTYWSDSTYSKDALLCGAENGVALQYAAGSQFRVGDASTIGMRLAPPTSDGLLVRMQPLGLKGAVEGDLGAAWPHAVGLGGLA